MAEKERKEIVIEMKADLKELLTNLKKMPDVTGKEARQMVNALEKEFRKANAAAKAAAKTQKKSFKQVEVSAKKAESSIRGLRKQSRELGGSFNAMGDVLTEVNPEMAQFAMGAELAGDGFRSFSRILATGNPILIGLVAGIVAAVAAYAAFTAEARENEASQKKLEGVLTATNAKIRAQKAAADGAADAMFNHAGAANDAALEYQLLNGQLTEAELNELKLEKRAGDVADKINEQGKARERSLKKVIDLENTNVRAIEERRKKLVNLGRAFEKEETSRGVQLVQTAEYAALSRELAVTRRAVQIAEEDLGKAQEENALLADSAAQRFLENAQKAQKLRDKRKRDEENERRLREQQREDERVRNETLREQQKELARIKKLDEEIFTLRQQASTATASIQLENRKKTIALMSDEEKKLKESHTLEMEQLAEKIEAIKEELLIAEGMVETRDQLLEFGRLEQESLEQINALEQQRGLVIQENAKAIEKLNKQQRSESLKMAEEGISQLGAIATASGQIISNLSDERKKAAITQFRISQAVNIAEIIMTTAKNINEVFPDPVLTGLAAALGATQAAAVATTPPPEFHMGGMINKGPDAQVITALKGEAILDRSTVREIGGERGLRQIKNRGNQAQEVIIRTPFKHFDNYSKLNIKRGGALSKLQRTRSIGAY